MHVTYVHGWFSFLSSSHRSERSQQSGRVSGGPWTYMEEERRRDIVYLGLVVRARARARASG